MSSEIFTKLLGNWQFTRSVEGYGLAKGESCFMPKSERYLLYKEQGEFCLFSGKKLFFSRCYDYYLSENQQISVYLQGSFMYLLQFTDGISAVARYQCANDCYHASYSFINDQKLQISYYVEGPNKNYHINTYLFR